MFFNGQKIETIEQLETAMTGLAENVKQALRNDFNGVPNAPIKRQADTVTPRQFRLAMLRAGIPLSFVETALQNLSEPLRSEALISWEYATEFRRDNPLFALAGQLLGMTDEQVDTLFHEASKL